MRPNGVHLRFAIATAAAIAAAGAATLWFAQREQVRGSERDVTAHARYVEAAILRDELARRDLTGTVSGAELRRLDWLFDARVLIGGGLRVKLYRRDGRISYSNVHSLIGTRADDPAEIRAVLGGGVVHDVARLNHEGGTGADAKALEVYVPVQLRGSTRPDGVFELYQSYAPVAAAVRAFVMPFTGIVLLTLLGLWLVLFPLLRRMSRALDRDRTARRDAEEALRETTEQLRQSQKLESIGRLAGGVAHDFNNLLLAVNGYAEFLVSELTTERHRAFAHEILGAGQRAARLTQQLLAFSRRQVLQPRVLDLNEAVVEAESMLRPALGDGIEVALELDAGLSPVEADPGQVSQVLVNLAVNARDAMGGAGTLVLATRNEDDRVVLSVSDTGCGMDEETRSQIFEPFFTTKGMSGTGLGLSTVYGIVTQSGGSIDVSSAPGVGTTFVVRLPAAAGRPVADLRASLPAHRGDERVLVVDDERVARELVAQMLVAQGYRVTVAASPAEALALAGGWDLLVSDVSMPWLDGPDLATQIDARRVLFVSGHAPDGLDLGDAPLLRKPFDVQELARAVRALLDREPALA